MASRIPGFSPSGGKEPLPTHHVISKENIERRMGELGGCTFDSTVQAYIPIYPEKVHEAWLAQKEIIREKLGQIYPKDTEAMGSYFWKNTAKTVEDLLEHAKQGIPHFKAFLEGIATALEGKTYFGEGDEHIVKTRDSIKDKVKRFIIQQAGYGNTVSEQIATMLINDSLRGTIIVNDIPQCLKVLAMLRNECAIVKYDLVFSNKFEDDYKNGYIGIHAKVVYKYTFSGQERSVVSEVQIHFNAIENGTPFCPSQVTHSIYEQTRQINENGSVTSADSSAISKESLEAAIKMQFLIGMEKIV